MKIDRLKILLFFCIFSLLVNTTRAQQTYDIERIEKAIDNYLGYFSNTNPGAIILVIKKEQILFSKAYGMANIETQKELNTEYLFNLAELSKAFTSVAIMKLVEKHKLDLDNSINDIFKDFPEYGSQISIRNLLNHTSGLRSYNIETVTNNDDVLTFLKSQRGTKFIPGTKWESSNSDYALLAKIIEQRSGMTYKDFLKKYIFKKLSMNNTFLTEDIVDKELVASRHYKEDGKYIVKNNLDYVYGEQGIYTNINDFIKWDMSLYTDKIIKCENLKKIFSVSKLNDGSNTPYYGLGWIIMDKQGDRYFWQGASKNGYSNLIFHLPDEQETVLILANRNDAYDFFRLAIIIAKQFHRDLKL